MPGRQQRLGDRRPAVVGGQVGHDDLGVVHERLHARPGAGLLLHLLEHRGALVGGGHVAQAALLVDQHQPGAGDAEHAAHGAQQRAAAPSPMLRSGVVHGPEAHRARGRACRVLPARVVAGRQSCVRRGHVGGSIARRVRRRRSGGSRRRRSRPRISTIAPHGRAAWRRPRGAGARPAGAPAAARPAGRGSRPLDRSSAHVRLQAQAVSSTRSNASRVVRSTSPVTLTSTRPAVRDDADRERSIAPRRPRAGADCPPCPALPDRKRAAGSGR